VTEFVVDRGCRVWGLKSNDESMPAGQITFYRLLTVSAVFVIAIPSSEPSDRIRGDLKSSSWGEAVEGRRRARSEAKMM
jgi:hypothetical protein